MFQRRRLLTSHQQPSFALTTTNFTEGSSRPITTNNTIITTMKRGLSTCYIGRSGLQLMLICLAANCGTFALWAVHNGFKRSRHHQITQNWLSRRFFFQCVMPSPRHAHVIHAHTLTPAYIGLPRAYDCRLGGRLSGTECNDSACTRTRCIGPL